MKPKFIVAANWKLNKGPRESIDFLKAFLGRGFGEASDGAATAGAAQSGAKTSGAAQSGVSTSSAPTKIMFFVPAIDLWVVQQALRDTAIEFGAQNAYHQDSGAFTGENSMAVIKEIGCHSVLIGHSERRTLFGETNKEVALKVQAAHRHQLLPLICVGESLEERENEENSRSDF